MKLINGSIIPDDFIILLIIAMGIVIIYQSIRLIIIIRYLKQELNKLKEKKE